MSTVPSGTRSRHASSVEFGLREGASLTLRSLLDSQPRFPMMSGALYQYVNGSCYCSVVPVDLVVRKTQFVGIMSSTNAAASAARKMSTKWVWRRRHMGLTINPPIPLLFTPQYRSQATKRHHLIAQNQLGISRGIAVVLGGTLVASFATAAFRKDNEPEAGSADEFTQSAQLALSKRPLMEVLRATFVFEVVSRPFLVECGKKTFNIFDSLGLTWLYRPLVKKTFFAHFCGCVISYLRLWIFD